MKARKVLDYIVCGVVIMTLTIAGIVLTVLFIDSVSIKMTVLLLLMSANLFFNFFLGYETNNSILLLKNNKTLAGINASVLILTIEKQKRTVKIKYISSAFTDLLGYSRDEVQKVLNSNINTIMIDEDLEKIKKEVLKSNDKNELLKFRFRARRNDGSIALIYLVGRIKQSISKINLQAITIDISSKDEIERETLFKERVLRLAIGQTQSAIFDFSFEDNSFNLMINSLKITGYTEHEIKKMFIEKAQGNIKKFLYIFIHEDDGQMIEKMIAQLLERSVSKCEIRIKNKDGKFKWCSLYCTMSYDSSGNKKSLIGSLADINELKHVNELLKEEVQIDPMTNVYNKTTTQYIISETLINESKNNHAFMLMDIDDFKGINDNFGHLYGDSVLIKFASRLKRIFRNYDIIGRVGGDEFVVFMKNVGDINLVLKKANEINVNCKSFLVGKSEYKISCSIGIVLTDGCSDYDDIFANADRALYQSKANGKDCCWIYSGNETVDITDTKKETENEKIGSARNILDSVLEMFYNYRGLDSAVDMALSLLGETNSLGRMVVCEILDGKLRVTYEWKMKNTDVTVLGKTFEGKDVSSYLEQLASMSFIIVTPETCPEFFNEVIRITKGKKVLQVVSSYKGEINAFFSCQLPNFEISNETINNLCTAYKIIGNFIRRERLQIELDELKH